MTTTEIIQALSTLSIDERLTIATIAPTSTLDAKSNSDDGATIRAAIKNSG
jgi:hypothetical protein